MTNDVDDKILFCILTEYKSVSRITEDIGEPRNKIQVHIFKLRKWKQVVRCLNDNGDQGVLGWKYKTSYQQRREIERKVRNNKLNL